jgi:ankyrin repeat protein
MNKVRNPLTGRLIKIGGPTWKKLMRNADATTINKLQQLAGSKVTKNKKVKKRNKKQKDNDILKTIEKDDIVTMKKYVKDGLDRNKIINGYDLLILSVDKKAYKIADYLLSFSQLKRNRIDKDGDTPLTLAIVMEDLKMINILYAHHVDMNKNHPLFLAVDKNLLNAFEKLLKYKYGPNISDIFTVQGFHHNIISYIIEKRNSKAFKILSDNIDDSEMKSLINSYVGPNYNYTPISFAVSKNFIEMVKELIKKGGDPNFHMNSSSLRSFISPHSPLSLAISLGYHKIAKYLIENGSNINYKRVNHEVKRLPMNKRIYYLNIIDMHNLYKSDFCKKTKLCKDKGIPLLKKWIKIFKKYNYKYGYEMVIREMLKLKLVEEGIVDIGLPKDISYVVNKFLKKSNL